MVGTSGSTAERLAAVTASGRSLQQLLAPLRHVQVWRFSLYYVVVFGAYVALSSWLPKFYVENYGISLAQAGVQPVLLPGSVYAQRSQTYPEARDMIDDGLAIVLATDFNPGSSPTPSMTAVFSLAATQMRLTAAESITAATVNAAYSLGRGDRIGTLEPGKLADIVIHDCRDYRELAYFYGVEHAWKVFLGGYLVYER